MNPPIKTGPAPFAIIVGVLGLAMAALLTVTELTTVTIPWRVAGPISIVVLGGLILAIGAFGLVSSRRREAVSLIEHQSPRIDSADKAASAVETNESFDTSDSGTQAAADVDPPTS